MYVTPEQIAATNKAGVDALMNLAHTQFAAFEKLSALNFNATKAAFENSVNIAKAMSSVKDVQEMLGIPLLGAIPEDPQVGQCGYMYTYTYM